jgi:hypothetical protein
VSGPERSDMRRSYLVQRLNKPAGQTFLGMVDNPFAFGGGLKNGGLSDEAMGLLRGVFSFDYMGAAEFEFGAVPEALHMLAKAAGRKVLTAYSFTIPLSEVEPDWRDRKKTAPDGEGTVYVLCRADQADEVTARIQGWARKDYQGLKESTQLPRALRPAEDGWQPSTAGWLELDNGFMFFTDRDMWAATCALFGVAAEVSA